MIRLIKNEIIKIKLSKIIFTYILFIISLLLINKYSNKNIFDMSYNLIPFIGIVISILFSGSICFEIDNGTMRYYLTKPFKRYKVYLSKLLTILIYILMSYIIIVSITSLIAYKIDYIYMYKFFIHMIPIIFLSSFILFLSTSFKSHVLVSCISILTLSFSLTISQILFGLKINIVEYTFLPYLDYSLFNDKSLLISMNQELNTNLSVHKGLALDTLYFALFYLFGTFKFCKKDIKN